MGIPSYKLVMDEDLSLEDLRGRIEGGYRFLVFRYDIGLLFISFRRFSSAILVPPDSSISRYARLYNAITLLVGWISIPVGPLTAVRTLMFNMDGGVDVTRDVMLNIDATALANRHVSIPTTHALFSKPTKADIKAVRKAIQQDFDGDSNLKLLIYGLFINTNEPHFTIGLKVGKNDSEYQNKVLKSLYRKFRKTTYFEFLSQEEFPLEFGLLVEQGEVIYAHPEVDLEKIVSSVANRTGAEISAQDLNSLRTEPDDF